ncbi:related to L-serine dehydratase [Cephalotrichum gorgonifer]|uniref:L-serine ammonia-lyase n=1 Tax=Cephalotrichum gorgonifer TaxID=2041049 RepID=A0AAE8MPF7_9PEZI|nr:related to L-serine dehydratase [Cephalotrichum gorgonifer]
MGDEPSLPSPLWIRTPCIYSEPLSKAAGCNIFLKLENLQPSGSFKSRGIGNLISRTAAKASSASPARTPHFYCSSGGNAGLACITAAASLSLPATIVVPHSTSPRMISLIRDLGAEVHQVGASWVEADVYMRESLMAADPSAVYVPPFDHPDIWSGAATLVDELVDQMAAGGTIHGVVCSVGGGGLLNGVMQGIDRLNWPAGQKPRVMAVETDGADSLNLCARTGKHATLDAITSIATSLGARKVSAESYAWLSKAKGGDLTSVVVRDWEAALSCARFADDARFVVEAACGATIATAYFGAEDGQHRLQRAFERPGLEWRDHNVVLVVCGGSNVTLGMLEEYRVKYGTEAGIGRQDEVLCRL